LVGEVCGAVAPIRYVRYLRRTINTPFFSLTMDIRDPTRTGFIRQQGEDAIVAERSIRRQHRASLPLEQISLDQQLGKSLDKEFGETACRNFRNVAHCTPTAL
jgi:hypothetical protein